MNFIFLPSVKEENNFIIIVLQKFLSKVKIQIIESKLSENYDFKEKDK